MHGETTAGAGEQTVDLAIIGAGPAGMAAALTAVEAGLSVRVIDEQARAGGQILRQPPRAFQVAGWLAERVYRRPRAVLATVEQHPQIEWCWQTTVLGVLDEGARLPGQPHRLWLHGPSGSTELAARAVLIAAGCHDMAMPFPGWNLPGVMAAGGVQAMVKSQQFLPGERFVFAGTHPLQLIVAEQMLRAGGIVAGVYFAQPFARFLQVLRDPLLLAQNATRMLYIAKVLWRLRRAGVPVHFSRTVVAAEGQCRLERVAVAAVSPDGRTVTPKGFIAADRLGVCYSFLVTSELARQAGAAVQWSADQGGWVVITDTWQRTAVPGLYAAGETTGVAGAEAALESGRLAALAALADLGTLSAEAAAARARPVQRKLGSLRRFASLLAEVAMPPEQLFDTLMDDTVVLCKCQEITAGTVREALLRYPAMLTANAVKLRTRVGMGLCQGRYCSYPLTRLIAAQTGRSEAAIGPFRAQLPIRPVPISELVD